MSKPIFLFCFITALVSCDDKIDCVFPKDISPEAKNGEAQISTFRGKRLKAEDQSYTYDIGICTSVFEKTEEDKYAGVVQTKIADQTVHVLGRFNQTDIYAGPEWVLLEYAGGDNYTSAEHCNKESRRALIMFICDLSVTEDQVMLLEEKNSKSEDCYYLFEISTPVVCPPPKAAGKRGLSVGSILLIVFFSVAAFYVLVGCVYNRFVLKAKGIDQIPHLSFWQDFGNLQADGCDLVCRSRTSREPRTYKGVGDDQLGDTEHTTDEHLLPM